MKKYFKRVTKEDVISGLIVVGTVVAIGASGLYSAGYFIRSIKM